MPEQFAVCAVDVEVQKAVPLAAPEEAFAAVEKAEKVVDIPEVGLISPADTPPVLVMVQVADTFAMKLSATSRVIA